MKCYGWREVAGDNVIKPIAPDNPNDKFDDIKIYRKALTYIQQLNKMVGYEKFEVVEINRTLEK